MSRANLRGPLFAAATALFLAGCSMTSQPLTQAELTEAANASFENLTADQAPIAAPIDLYEAMARALKYNLDHRVEMMQVALAQRNLTSAGVEMLPQLVANSGYSSRDNSSASFSQTLVSGIRSAEPSFSTEQSTLTADLTFSWHVLDFGLSYVRAKQAADQALVAEETKRKIVNRIIEDVRTAYWRAVSADRLLAGFRALEGRVEHAQAQTRRIQRSGQTSTLTALTYERELVDIKKEIQRLDRELVTSKAQLAALMNVKPGTPFKLVTPHRHVADITIPVRGNDAILEALRNRPEMRELLYQARINQSERDAVLLNVLPNPGVFAGLNYDSNDFLFNNNWITYGAKASWNAMSLFQLPARRNSVAAEANLIAAQMRALSMAIATQVNIAQARYHLLKKSASTAAEYYNVQRKILHQIRTQVNAGAASDQTLIREEMNTLVASVEFDVAFADLQNAFASVYASIGVDPHDESLAMDMNVDQLAASLRTTWEGRGDKSG